MKKRYLVGLVAVTLLGGTALGAYWALYVWEADMTMMLVSGDWSIELQFQNGTAMSAYNWGPFTEGQTKNAVFNVVNVGDVAYNMTWDTDLNLTAWSLVVYYENETTHEQTIWPAGGWGGPLEPGGGFPLNFNLTETNAIPNEPYSFKLNFYTGYQS